MFRTFAKLLLVRIKTVLRLANFTVKGADRKIVCRRIGSRTFAPILGSFGTRALRCHRTAG